MSAFNNPDANMLESIETISESDGSIAARIYAITFGISKSTVHKDVTLKNGSKIEHVGTISSRPFPESIEIKKVFLAEKNPIVRLGLLVK